MVWRIFTLKGRNIVRKWGEIRRKTRITWVQK